MVDCMFELSRAFVQGWMGGGVDGDDDGSDDDGSDDDEDGRRAQ